jgi:hypothetical protein
MAAMRNRIFSAPDQIESRLPFGMPPPRGLAGFGNIGRLSKGSHCITTDLSPGATHDASFDGKQSFWDRPLHKRPTPPQMRA